MRKNTHTDVCLVCLQPVFIRSGSTWTSPAAKERSSLSTLPTSSLPDWGNMYELFVEERLFLQAANICDLFFFLGPAQKLFQSEGKAHRAPCRGTDPRGPRQGSGPDLHRHEGQDRVLQLQEPREASAPLQMGGHQRHLQRLEDKVRGVTFACRGLEQCH